MLLGGKHNFLWNKLAKIDRSENVLQKFQGKYKICSIKKINRFIWTNDPVLRISKKKEEKGKRERKRRRGRRKRRNGGTE